MAPARSRPASATRAAAAITLARAQRMTGLALDNADLTPLISLIQNVSWIEKVGATPSLRPGQLSKGRMEIPQTEARTALRGVVRLVADLPRNTSPIVVWESNGSELEVDTAATTLTCKVGMVTIGMAVRCDQVPDRTVIDVPLGVGTAERPTGLVMSALTHVDGPSVIVDRWSDALTAFAWECLVETSRRLCELTGTDASGRHLVPGAIAAGTRVLIVQPMSPFGRR